MNTQASWQKIRDELQRLTNVEHLKHEVNRIGSEIRNFDFHTMLSPTAQARVRHFERRYSELMRNLQQAQRQMDREFNRLVRQIKHQKAGVTKAVSTQKERLEKVSDDLRRRFAGGRAQATAKTAATRKAKAAKRTTTRTTGTKKRRKA